METQNGKTTVEISEIGQGLSNFETQVDVSENENAAIQEEDLDVPMSTEKMYKDTRSRM